MLYDAAQLLDAVQSNSDLDHLAKPFVTARHRGGIRQDTLGTV